MTEDTVRTEQAQRTDNRFVRPVVMKKLADATRAEHCHIEANPLLSRLMQEANPLNTYRCVLARFYGFYRPIEALLLADPQIRNHPDLASRLNKHQLLARDLQILGLSSKALQQLPRYGNDLPEGYHWHESLGALYVMEGATLGGQLIRKQLLSRLEPRWHEALQFYSCYQSEVGPRWRRFQLLLADNLSDEQDGNTGLEMAIAAARNTFRQMDEWLLAEHSEIYPLAAEYTATS